MAQMGPGAAEAMKQTPMYQVYAALAPTLIVVGDADSVRTSHAVEFFERLGGGQADGGWDRSGMSRARLAVLSGTTHYTIFSSPRLASTVIPFLNAPMVK
jgi:alpha-beta hydrolase superfamily lysophospholipase